MRALFSTTFFYQPIGRALSEEVDKSNLSLVDELIELFSSKRVAWTSIETYPQAEDILC